MKKILVLSIFMFFAITAFSSCATSPKKEATNTTGDIATDAKKATTDNVKKGVRKEIDGVFKGWTGK
jgi:outer membrane protein assembly factor BamE (lipoprotein component of BamABCDE complex)